MTVGGRLTSQQVVCRPSRSGALRVLHGAAEGVCRAVPIVHSAAWRAERGREVSPGPPTETWRGRWETSETRTRARNNFVKQNEKTEIKKYTVRGKVSGETRELWS